MEHPQLEEQLVNLLTSNPGRMALNPDPTFVLCHIRDLTILSAASLLCIDTIVIVRG